MIERNRLLERILEGRPTASGEHQVIICRIANNNYQDIGAPFRRAAMGLPFTYPLFPIREVRSRMPGGSVTSFIDRAMKESQMEQLPSGRYYAEVPSCEGVWADGNTAEECLYTLQEVLEDWLIFKLRDGDRDFPVYGDIDINAEWKEDVSWAGSK